MTAREVSELAEPPDDREPFDLRTTEGAWAYAQFIPSRGGSRPSRAQCVHDAAFIREFGGGEALILVWDNRRAIVPSQYAAFCESAACPQSRKPFGYGGVIAR